MGRKITVGILLLTLGLLGVGGAVAGAQGYSGNATLVCSPDVVAPGGTIGIVLTGAPPGAEVTFSYDTIVGTAIADEDGTASFDVTIPEDAQEGPVDIVATWDEDGVELTASCLTTIASGDNAEVLGVTVAAGQQALPATGSDSTVPVAQIGIVLVVIGTAVALIARKRSNARAAEPVG